MPSNDKIIIIPNEKSLYFSPFEHFRSGGGSYIFELKHNMATVSTVTVIIVPLL